MGVCFARGKRFATTTYPQTNEVNGVACVDVSPAAELRKKASSHYSSFRERHQSNSSGHLRSRTIHNVNSENNLPSPLLPNQVRTPQRIVQPDEMWPSVQAVDDSKDSTHASLSRRSRSFAEVFSDTIHFTNLPIDTQIRRGHSVRSSTPGSAIASPAAQQFTDHVMFGTGDAADERICLPRLLFEKSSQHMPVANDLCAHERTSCCLSDAVVENETEMPVRVLFVSYPDVILDVISIPGVLLKFNLTARLSHVVTFQGWQFAVLSAASSLCHVPSDAVSVIVREYYGDDDDSTVVHFRHLLVVVADAVTVTSISDTHCGSSTFLSSAC
jgi:hypothetical protein